MRLPFVPAEGLCRRCGRDAPGLTAEFLCEDCAGQLPAFDRAGSALRFENEARELVNAFKFRQKIHLVPDLVDFLEGYARTRFRIDDIDLVIPMPATLGHRFLRGYNQCAMLARLLAKRLKRKYDARSLKRTGSPKRQGGLGEEERRENVIGTFTVTPHGLKTLRGTVLLVDDIMTTGSTFAEAAKTLKTIPGLRVWCLSVCRSIRD